MNKEDTIILTEPPQLGGSADQIFYRHFEKQDMTRNLTSEVSPNGQRIIQAMKMFSITNPHELYQKLKTELLKREKA